MSDTARDELQVAVSGDMHDHRDRDEGTCSIVGQITLKASCPAFAVVVPKLRGFASLTSCIVYTTSVVLVDH